MFIFVCLTLMILISTLIDIAFFVLIDKRITQIEDGYIVHSKILHALVDNLPKKEGKKNDNNESKL